MQNIRNIFYRMQSPLICFIRRFILSKIDIRQPARGASLIAILVLFFGANSTAFADDNNLANAQALLKILGLYDGKLDGLLTSKTDAALRTLYLKQGTQFDGKFNANTMDKIYSALNAAPPFHGRPPKLSAKDGRTAYSKVFDFVPQKDLSTELPDVIHLTPFDQFGAKIHAVSQLPGRNNNLCNWVSGEHFPLSGQKLHTYSSFAEFNGPAKRRPNQQNKWLDDLNFYSARASAHLAANPTDLGVADEFKTALLNHSAAGSALDIVDLLDRGSGKVIVTPDFVSATIASTGITLNYLMVRPILNLTPQERTQIEKWLDRLFETYPANYFLINPANSVYDPRAVDLVARAEMAAGLLRNDPALFNSGAHHAATFLSFTRSDGSHRFGASRGNRALWYTGSAMSDALDALVLIESQGLPAREIMLPTLSRMADFWQKAWFDHTTLFPYAKENNATFTGSNYKEQDHVEVAAGVDIFLDLSPVGPVAARLREARKAAQWSTIYSENFNATCVGLGLLDAN